MKFCFLLAACAGLVSATGKHTGPSPTPKGPAPTPKPVVITPPVLTPPASNDDTPGVDFFGLDLLNLPTDPLSLLFYKKIGDNRKNQGGGKSRYPVKRSTFVPAAPLTCPIGHAPVVDTFGNQYLCGVLQGCPVEGACFANAICCAPPAPVLTSFVQAPLTLLQAPISKCPIGSPLGHFTAPNNDCSMTNFEDLDCGYPNVCPRGFHCVYGPTFAVCCTD